MDKISIDRLLARERPELSKSKREEMAAALAGREWSVNDVADLYGVSWSTVVRWIDRGEIEATKSGYYWIVEPTSAMEAPGRWTDGWYHRKLSVENILEIRERGASGDVHRRIAEDFDVHESLITRILSRERYEWVEEE